VVNELKKIKTLNRQQHKLADSFEQVAILNDDAHLYKLVPFSKNWKK